VRDSFSMTLRLDEVTGAFHCACEPPPTELSLPEILTEWKRWSKAITQGWARRYNARRSARIDCGKGFTDRVMRGQMISTN
jgi:hypothetical protein